MSLHIPVHRGYLIPLLLILCTALILPRTSYAAEAVDGTRPRIVLFLEHEEESVWNTLLKEALGEASAKYGITARIVVENREDEQERVFRDAMKNCDFALVATDHFHEILRDNARRYPNVRFGVIDAGIRGKNIRCISFADEQASFLAGAGAALFAKNMVEHNGKEPAIGWISGEDVAAMRSLFNGYSEGARLAVPGIRVIHGIAGSFGGKEGARAEAKRLIREGCNVLVLASGAGNPIILEEARQAGIYVIGLDTDQQHIYKNHVLLSILKDVKGAVLEIIDEYCKGSFKGSEIDIYTLDNGVSITKIQSSIGTKNTKIDKIEKRLLELSHEIKTGGIKIKSLRQKTLCNCL
ncbi:MAG: BMP family ABC transporter substrate-binding protein [Desulfovibrio sp.]|nr:BMP family ABC transporter substrate-binding protein [Desulfovibrio sp.]